MYIFSSANVPEYIPHFQRRLLLKRSEEPAELSHCSKTCQDERFLTIKRYLQ